MEISEVSEIIFILPDFSFERLGFLFIAFRNY